MQTIIVFLIVALAFYFVARRLYDSFREDSKAGCGCDCCSLKSGRRDAARQVCQIPESCDEMRE